MKNPFKPGDIKEYRLTVTEKDLAEFESEQVHPVYSTFALARDAEWACRLFVLDMKEEDEEGIGTMITVHHVSPAPLGAEVRIQATVKSIQKNNVICQYEVFVGSRLIAHGEQGQKILKREKLQTILNA